MANDVLKTLKSDSLYKINQGKGRTHTFNVDFTDISEGLTGKFVVHHPTQMEKLQMGVIKSNLLSGMRVDVSTDNIAHIISTLDVVIDSKPVWFDVDNIELTYEIMEAVYLEYADWIDSFRRPNRPTDTLADSTGAASEVPVVGTEDISGTSD